MAADLLRGPLPEPTYVPAAPAAFYDWSGFYVGVNVGYGGDRDRYGYSVTTAANNNNYGYGGQWGNGGDWGAGSSSTQTYSGSEGQRSNGVLGGVQAGYNYAFGNVIVGAEADFDGSGISSGGALRDFAQYGLEVNVGTHMNYFGTVRGRLGYAFDCLMVYGTGGFAYADATSTISDPNAYIGTNVSKFYTGYAIGGGIEFAYSKNILLRAEFLRTEYGSKVIGQGNPWLNYTATLRPSDNIVRVGLDYKFSSYAPAPLPVIARY